ncbi:DUF86 domain-containing protein [Aquisalimonas lutea]|uniref:type VII toxin-antitoxin system HepT family RNase toxin n=1 Tax=Aquisalimonas lutea TaxID=1327750 RepID=UPI0025B4E62D|nr:DUF86 domain-containing protein [Aquisalimonas lutea]MDN3517813.1 DUF86 domain-containing protein [Aquisalimonas lutea]
MTDADLLEKKLAFIETCVRELRELARPERIGDDVRETRFVEHTLQLAIQSALDAASHVVSMRRLGEPETNRALFESLRRAGLVEPPLAESLYAMAGFRNILVHGYQEVDVAVVRDIVDNHLDDLLAFARSIRAAT